MTQQEVERLIMMVNRLRDYYNNPVISKKGKLEGLCLIIKGLQGLIGKYDKVSPLIRFDRNLCKAMKSTKFVKKMKKFNNETPLLYKKLTKGK